MRTFYCRQVEVCGIKMSGWATNETQQFERTRTVAARPSLAAVASTGLFIERTAMGAAQLALWH